MGIWRFAGAFAVVKRQSECGSKNLRNARQPANADRRVLAVRCFFIQYFRQVSWFIRHRLWFPLFL